MAAFKLAAYFPAGLIPYNFSILYYGFVKQKKYIFVGIARNILQLLSFSSIFKADNLLAQLMLII